jgi:shikimate kinase
MRIYIIGFMGSGKSTYGKELAAKLGFNFLDLDNAIEMKEKSTIAKIFKDKGEDTFRKMELDALLETNKLENTVIATGGGAPCFHNNMQWMNDNGITIYLKMFEGDLKRRIEPDMETRPLLNGLKPDELDDFIYNTLRERAFFYHQAKYVIDPSQIGAEGMASILNEG